MSENREGKVEIRPYYPAGFLARFSCIHDGIERNSAHLLHEENRGTPIEGQVIRYMLWQHAHEFPCSCAENMIATLGPKAEEGGE